VAQADRRNTKKRVALAKAKGEFFRYLRIAEKEQIVITRHGKPAAVVIGFRSE
jgi:prevent-host-death family protein